METYFWMTLCPLRRPLRYHTIHLQNLRQLTAPVCGDALILMAMECFIWKIRYPVARASVPVAWAMQKKKWATLPRVDRLVTALLSPCILLFQCLQSFLVQVFSAASCLISSSLELRLFISHVLWNEMEETSRYDGDFPDQIFAKYKTQGEECARVRGQVM